jgi:hypothetical protein
MCFYVFGEERKSGALKEEKPFQTKYRRQKLRLSGGIPSVRRTNYCGQFPPSRHCEGRRPVAIQCARKGALRPLDCHGAARLAMTMWENQRGVSFFALTDFLHF